MDLLSTAKDLLKRVYSAGVTATQNIGKYPEGFVPSSKYETDLDALEESNYQQWHRAQARHKVSQGEKPDSGYDYDSRGWWKENVGLNPSGKKYNDSFKSGHRSDRFKKPNHPTFSTESKYSGVDGYQGGEWVDGAFKPSREMKNRVSREGLFKYFEKNEPNVQLLWPKDINPRR